MRASDDHGKARLGSGADARGARLDPLALWRSAPLPDIGSAAIVEVRRALAGNVLLHHRRWIAARRGDAAAAIAVSLDLARGPAPDAVVADLALSSVLVPAWRGDAAARAVLAHVRHGLPCDPTSEPGEIRRVPPPRPRAPRR